MPSTPLICCSSGIVTADSTTCAFAPTKLLLTVTWGGARVGYSEIGRPGMPTAPARIISRAHTVAKIGRLMKKSTKHALHVSSRAEHPRQYELGDCAGELIGCMGAPSMRNWIPEVMTFSPAFNPSVTA